MDRVHGNVTVGPGQGPGGGAEAGTKRPGGRGGQGPRAHEQGRGHPADPPHQRGDGLPAHRASDRAPPVARDMTESDEHYGVKALPELYKEWSASGMVANIGTRLVEVDYGKLVLEGHMTAESHGFPTSRGPIVHGGAIATLADEALASVAFTVAEEGGTTLTADLKIDFLRPAKPGRLVARATVRHRARRLAVCAAWGGQGHSHDVAEARAVIAYVKA